MFSANQALWFRALSVVIHVKLSRQNTQDSQGLVGGAEHHPGGQEPTTRGELAGPVAAEVETGGDAAGADLIGRAQARHAGGGHHILVGEALQHGVDQKGLVLRGVEGLWAAMGLA